MLSFGRSYALLHFIVDEAFVSQKHLEAEITSCVSLMRKPAKIIALPYPHGKYREFCKQASESIDIFLPLEPQLVSVKVSFWASRCSRQASPMNNSTKNVS